MTRHNIYNVAVLLAVLSSCDRLPAGQGDNVFTLKVEMPELYGAAGAAWHIGDCISAGTGNISSALTEENLKNNAAVFTFAKPVSEGEHVRYPGTDDPSVLSVPSSVLSRDGQYAPAGNPLWGTVCFSGGEASASLGNSMAMLGFSIKGDNGVSLTKVTVKSIGGEALNGKFNVDSRGNLSFRSNENYGDINTVAFADALALGPEARHVYIPVLPAVYSKGFIMRLYGSDGKIMKVTFFAKGKRLAPDDIAMFELKYTGGTEEELTELGDIEPAVVRIGSYNVLMAESRQTPLQTEGRLNLSWRDAGAALASLVKKMDCDFVGFNELGKTTVTDNVLGLKKLLTDAGMGDAEYAFCLDFPNNYSYSDKYHYTNGYVYRKSVLEQIGDAKTVSLGNGGRTAVFVQLRHKPSGRLFWTVVTHLATSSNKDTSLPSGYDNVSQAIFLTENVRQICGDSNVVVLGDMNSSSTHLNKAYGYLLCLYVPSSLSPDLSGSYNTYPFTDACEEAGANGCLCELAKTEPGTNIGCCGGPNPGNPGEYNRIDHILLHNCGVSWYDTYGDKFTHTDGKQYQPSDHRPIAANVVF